MTKASDSSYNVLGHSVRVLLVTLLVLPQPIAPVVIVVEGDCTLVDAITAANTDVVTGSCVAGSGDDTVVLTEDVTLTSIDNGQNGLPMVTSEITLEGGDHAVVRDVDAKPFRIFQIAPEGTLIMSNTTVSNGSGEGDFFIDGAAILNDGTVTISDSTLSDNGGSFYSYGGSIQNSGVLTFVDSTLSGGVSPGGFGGGLFNRSTGVALIERSTLTANYADFGGGAISNSGSLTVADSLFYNNGAIYGAAGIWSGSDLTVVNSTFSGNSAVFYASAVLSYGVISNSTFSGNESYFGSTVDYARIANSVIGNSIGYSGANCGPNIVDNGNNLSDDASCGTIPDTLTGLDPLLADNGGPTLTHALVEGSNAIDAAGDCGLTTDQRGFARDPRCDSGAFEFGALPPVGGSADGIDLAFVLCRNQTSGQQKATLPSGHSWDCQATDLVLEPEDRITMLAFGTAGGEAPVSASLVGTLGPFRWQCNNITTGQRVAANSLDPFFDCQAAGLIVSAGDRIRLAGGSVVE